MEHVVKLKQLPVLDLDFVKQKKVSVSGRGGNSHLIFCWCALDMANQPLALHLIESFFARALSLKIDELMSRDNPFIRTYVHSFVRRLRWWWMERRRWPLPRRRCRNRNGKRRKL